MDDPEHRLAIPLGTWWNTNLYLSYGIFFAAAVVVAVGLVSRSQPGNSDLPRVVALGCVFWIAGWTVQLATHALVATLMGLRLGSLALGVFGIESAPRLWPASRTLIVSIATITSLLVLASFFRLVEGGFQMPVVSDAPENRWIAPSFGFTAHDSIWRSAAWLCCVQAAFQMFPLPRTMGRQVLAALASLCSRRLDLNSQVRVLQRCLMAVAIVTLILAIGILVRDENQASIPRWPLFVFLSVLLWISCYRKDVSQIMAGFQSAAESSEGISSSLLSRVRSLIRTRRERKKILRTMQRERNEAVDAARLDEILHRLHSEGPSSLSDEDRVILDRVSNTLRQQRE